MVEVLLVVAVEQVQLVVLVVEGVRIVELEVQVIPHQFLLHKEIQVVLVFKLQVIPLDLDLLINMVLEAEVVLQALVPMDTEVVLLLIVVKVD